MPLQKNQVLTLTIERLSNDGSGVAHSPDGEAVFVPGTAPGDEADVRIVKDCGRYAFGILDSLRTPSPHRIPVDCAVAGPCGGCSLRHLDYAAELRAKQESVTDAFRRIGGLDVPVLDALPSPEVDRYRNKVQFPVGRDKNGAPCIGFYAGRTHRIVPCPDCKLQPGVLNDIGNALCAFFAANHIQPYDEATGKGLVRHIFLRRGAHSGQIMVCIVCTRPKLPHSAELAAQLQAQFPAIATILVNVNAKNTNVILGAETHTLSGPGFIEDTLCGVPVRLGPLSFYQVNTLAAERLYGIAADYAQLQPEDLLLDLYCGMGTIGLSMADRCRELIGVEIVPEAIESAKANAARMGSAVAAKSRFFCADAGKAASQLAAEGLHPDVIVLDPPRKGCDEATLSAVVRMAPRRVVYVSCNPATAARDAAWQAVASRFNVEITSSIPNNMEINAPGVTKGSGLKTLADTLGLAMNQVTGDDRIQFAVSLQSLCQCRDTEPDPDTERIERSGIRIVSFTRLIWRLIQIQNDSQTSHEKQEESHPETLDSFFARISLEQQT